MQTKMRLAEDVMRDYSPRFPMVLPPDVYELTLRNNPHMAHYIARARKDGL